MTGILRSFIAISAIAIRRLWSNKWLTLAAILGLSAVIALALSVPLYTDAVYHRTLLTTVDDDTIDQQGVRRPPYTFMFRYAGKYDGAIDWEALDSTDRYMTDAVPGQLGLPRLLYVRFFETRLAQLFPLSDAAYLGKRAPLMWTSVGTAGDIESHIEIIDGAMAGAVPATDNAVQVVVNKALADKLGLQVGERFILFYRPSDSETVQLPVVVTGIWITRDLNDSFWYSHPESLYDMFLTTEAIFKGNIGSRMNGEVFQAVWYMVFDGSLVRSDNVAGLLDRIKLTMVRLTSLLSRVKLEISPVEALESYQSTSRLLTVQLLAINVPILLLMLAYTLLVSSLIVDDRRNEIAVLRSRGATVWQLLAIALLEAIIMGLLSIVTGSPLGQVLAQLVGQTRSFLNFTGNTMNGTPLQVVITLSGLTVALIAALVAVLLTLVPTVSAASHTIITYKQERARSMRLPWWQRTGLDLLLVIPAIYGTYMLQKQGTLVLPSAIGQSAATVQDPFANPLLFMVPVLSILSLTLVLIRILPYVLRFGAWILARFPGVTVVMASRQLARSPSLYAAPMFLLVLTLGLAAFTASLAATLDQHLSYEMRYATGGDMNVNELGESTRDTGSTVIGGISTGKAAEAANATGAIYTFLPIAEHLKVDGVLGATRIGRYRAEAQFSTRFSSARYMGIDRVDYPGATYWRSDYAEQPLGALMNALSTRVDAVLVPESVLAENALNIGDHVRLIVSLSDGNVPMEMTIAGTFRLWPGWNPKSAGAGPLFVGNLDYLFEQAGGQVPYEVWLKVRPGSDPKAIAAGIQKLGVVVISYSHAQTRVDLEQARPERQGLFGMLSIGFGAAGLFTVLGFFLYAVFSLKRRVIELGVLRAIGFSTRQMGVYLGCELALLLGVGIGAGTLLGVVASRIYIPFFQISASEEGRALPYAVMVAWPDIFRIYAVFAGLFIVALIALLLILRKMRVFEAVKLGESV